MKTAMRVILLAVTFITLGSFSASRAQDKGQDMQLTTPSIETAILAGGCFWCVESDFDKLDGVIETTSGYSGGTIPNPTYQNYNKPVEGFEPHVEVLEVKYDATKISYEGILDYYFRHIDPTDDGGQFCDRGASYRPVIYVQNDQERDIAVAKSKEVAALIKQDVKVDILEATQFWAAEGYHQNYYKENPVRYNLYRWNCGRDQKIEKIWKKAS